MAFDDRLTGTQTPHRLWALCKLIAQKKRKKSELRDLLQPQDLTPSQEAFENVFTLANKGKLISTEDNGFIKLKINKKYLDDINIFRKYLARAIFSDESLMFCRFSSWYLSRWDNGSTEKNDELAKNFHKEVFSGHKEQPYNSTNINAWKTWFCFLGLGFTHNDLIIPNAMIRIKDVIDENKREFTFKDALFEDFIKKLSAYCPELDEGIIYSKNKGSAEIKPRHITFGLYLGLRLLEDQKIVSLENKKDVTSYYILEKETNRRVSHITVKP